MWTSHLKEFIVRLRIEEGLSPKTIEAYEQDIQQFLLSFSEDLSPSIITNFSRELTTKGYSAGSISRKLTSIKRFCQFLLEEKVIDFDPNTAVIKPKIGMRIPKAIHNVEVNRLLTSPGATSDPYPLRDRAVLELMYACGLRVSEVISVRMDQLKEEVVHVIGKRNKERIVPVGSMALFAISLYIEKERPNLAKKSRDNLLFLNRHGKALTRQSIYTMVKKYAKRASIAPDTTPHTLRHSFATHLLDGDADLRDVQELLGHSNVSTTEIYTHVSQKKLKSAHQKFHPRQ